MKKLILETLNFPIWHKEKSVIKIRKNWQKNWQNGIFVRRGLFCGKRKGAYLSQGKPSKNKEYIRKPPSLSINEGGFKWSWWRESNSWTSSLPRMRSTGWATSAPATNSIIHDPMGFDKRFLQISLNFFLLRQRDRFFTCAHIPQRLLCVSLSWHIARICSVWIIICVII